MGTEVTFRRCVRFGIEIDRVIRTGLHAGFAPNANGWVKLDNTIVALVHRADGTDTHTGRVGAMITARHLEASAHVGIRASLGVFDPRAVHTKRHLVLRLARGRTSVTANALALVNEETVVFHVMISSICDDRSSSGK